MKHDARRVALVLIVALATGACGTVLGLDSYGNAPEDAGVDGRAASSEGGGSGDAAPEASEGAVDAPDAEAADDAGEGSDAAPDSTPVDAADEESDATEVDAADATPADAAIDATDGGPYAAPPGWTLVAFASTPQTTCPSGFTTAPTDVVFDTSTATPQSGACTCSACSLTAPPSCVTGAITGSYDTNGSISCSTTSQALANATPGGCNTDEPKSTLASVDYLWNPLPATGGSCTSGAPSPNPSRVAFTSHGHVCAADADAGAPAVGGAFALCILSAGDVACPEGPFQTAHSVGTGATITCASACGCTATATCTGATVTYYRSGSCGSATFAMGATSVCTSAYGGDVAYASYKYTATVSNPSCTATGTPTATVTGLTNEQTICCAP